jgi:hypothetical protein
LCGFAFTLLGAGLILIRGAFDFLDVAFTLFGTAFVSFGFAFTLFGTAFTLLGPAFVLFGFAFPLFGPAFALFGLVCFLLPLFGMIGRLKGSDVGLNAAGNGNLEYSAARACAVATPSFRPYGAPKSPGKAAVLAKMRSDRSPGSARRPPALRWQGAPGGLRSPNAAYLRT